jgi:hypothetical protein
MAFVTAVVASVGLGIMFFGFFNSIFTVGKVSKINSVVFVREIATVQSMYFMIPISLGIFVYVIFHGVRI